MNAGIPAQMLLDYATSIGAYFQLPLFRTPPRYKIKPEYLTEVFDGVFREVDEYGNKNTGTNSHCYHPAFQTLRKELERKKFIKTESWHNGDVVLEEFYLNGYLFEVGEPFSCPSALSLKLSRNSTTG